MFSRVRSAAQDAARGVARVAPRERPIAVVGAGVAGLTAALALVRRGRACTVFEATDRVGGLCATIDEDGVVAEPGASVVIGAAMLGEVLGPLGADPRQLLARDDPIARVLWPDGWLDLVGPVERLHDSLRPLSRADADGVVRLVAAGMRLADRLPDLLCRFKLGPLAEKARVARLLPWLAFSYRGLVRRNVRDPRLREALEAFGWFYAGLPPGRSPAALAAMPALAIADGCFRVEGGMQRLAEHLAGAVRAAGGEIRLGEPVRRLGARGEAVATVHTPHGVTAVSGVVATCDVARTVDLVPHPGPRARMRLRLAPLRRSVACVSVFGRGTVAPAAPRMTWVLRPGQHDRHGLLPMAAVALGPEGGVRIGGALRQGASLTDGGEALTTLVADAGLSVRLRSTRTWTPADYERRLRLPGGAAFGFEPSRTQLGPGRYGPRTPVANLVVAGQSCYPAFGIPFTALSGKLAAEVLMG
jgi:phytoene desaturase